MKIRIRDGAAIVAAGVLVAGMAACADEMTSDPEPTATTASEPTDTEDNEPTGDTEPSDPPTTAEDAPEDDATTGDSDTGSLPDDWERVEYGEYSFSVPPSWDVSQEEMDGQEVPRSSAGRGFCPEDPDQILASAALTWAEGETDPVQAVTDQAQRDVENYFSERAPEVEVGDVEHEGAWAAVPTTVELADTDDPCDGDEAMVVVKGAALEDGSGTILFVVVGELGLEDSPTPAELVEIANSFV